MNPSPIKRRALFVSYDGSRFFGWQKQADGIATVQSALEAALSELAQERISVVTAGRTDTGVHATAQVVHFDSAAQRPDQAWVRGVNALLPEGVAVWRVQDVAPEFHARFDACGRRYRYLLQSAPVRSPLLVGRAGWTHYAVDMDAMRQAAALLVGEHDFSSFRAAECQAKSPVKTLYRVALCGTPELMAVDFHGNAFLHHMVRNIVGTLLAVGDGRESGGWPAAVLVARDRKQAGMTAPAQGLYLSGVTYPPAYRLPSTPHAWIPDDFP